MTDENQRALFESWIVRSQESLKLGQTQVARVQLEAALQALYALPAVEKEASGDNAGLDLTRSEFERACSLLPPDFFWGLPVTPRLVLDIALAASPTVGDSARVMATRTASGPELHAALSLMRQEPDEVDITAGVGDSAGEPTLRQFRWVSPSGETSDWQDTGPHEIAHLNNYPPSRGGRYEFRELYAHPPAQTADVRAMTDAVHDVLAERQRQVKKEGWTPEHDDEHRYGTLSKAAACYAAHAAAGAALNDPGSQSYRSIKGHQVSTPWPWDAEWWKPTAPRHDLVKAGALILAEIERLDRKDQS